MVKVISCRSSDFDQLGNAVSSGGTVVFPTDTVYGLGSSPSSEVGVSKCLELKARDEGKPFPVLFSRIEDVKRVASLDQTALSLAKGFWPGALTIILPLREGAMISRKLAGSNGGLAVRIPNHNCCKELIVACGGSLIGTSANISGRKPSANWEDRDLQDFAKGADYFVKGECGSVRAPSTIVDLTLGDGIRFGREGAVTKDEVLSYLEKASRIDFSASKSMI
ncbi:MAG: L-threonylcarbamoyladenylate synthase [Nitrososphaerales archaeon]